MYTNLSLIFDICTPSSQKKIMYFCDMSEKEAFLLTGQFTPTAYLITCTLEKKSYQVCIIEELSICTRFIFLFQLKKNENNVYLKKTTFFNILKLHVLIVFALDEIGFFSRYRYTAFKAMILNYFCVKSGFVHLYRKKLTV